MHQASEALGGVFGGRVLPYESCYYMAFDQRFASYVLCVSQGGDNVTLQKRESTYRTLHI